MRGKGCKWVIKHSTEGETVEGTKRTRGDKLRAGEGRFLGVLGGERKEGGECEPTLPAVFRHLTAVKNNISICLGEETVTGAGIRACFQALLFSFSFKKKNLS